MHSYSTKKVKLKANFFNQLNYTLLLNKSKQKALVAGFSMMKLTWEGCE